MKSLQDKNKNKEEQFDDSVLQLRSLTGNLVHVVKLKCQISKYSLSRFYSSNEF